MDYHLMELTRGVGSWDLTSLSTKSNMAIERIHSEQDRPDQTTIIKCVGWREEDLGITMLALLR